MNRSMRCTSLAAIPFCVAMAACGLDDASQVFEQQSASEALASGTFESSPDKARAMEEAIRASEAGQPLPQHAACGTNGPNLDRAIHADCPLSGAVNQRSGSSTGCSAPGAIQPTDDCEYFCWTSGNDGFTWSFVRNVRTGVRGWVRDNLLDGNGARNGCGF